MWILRTSDADGAHTFRLVNGATKTLGRTPGADFIVDAPLISRLHCRLVAGPETLEIEDLASTNGTWVNGARVERHELVNGDRLRVGRVELTVEHAHN